MDNETPVAVESTNHRLQLAKVVLAAVAAYAAGELTKKSFDFAVLKFRDRPVVTEQ